MNARLSRNELQQSKLLLQVRGEHYRIRARRSVIANTCHVPEES